MDNIKELYLEGEAFDDARQKFNVVLQRLFKSMIDTSSNEGTVSLKLDVSMKHEFIPNTDPDVDGETREVRLPEFSYKVSSSITVKDEQKGNTNPQMELVWDDEQQKYVLQYVANTAQRSIFDKDFQDNMKSDSEEGTDALETDPEKKWMNVAQIAGPVADEGALPGEVAEADVVEDADFREVNESEEPEEPTEPEPDDGDSDSSPDTSQNGEEPEDSGQSGEHKYFDADESDASGYGYDEPEE